MQQVRDNCLGQSWHCDTAPIVDLNEVAIAKCLCGPSGNHLEMSLVSGRDAKYAAEREDEEGRERVRLIKERCKFQEPARLRVQSFKVGKRLSVDLRQSRSFTRSVMLTSADPDARTTKLEGLAPSTRILEQIRRIVTDQGISGPWGTCHINVPDRCPAGSVTGVRHLTETLPVCSRPAPAVCFSVDAVLSS